jgi:hypothetical protein
LQQIYQIFWQIDLLSNKNQSQRPTAARSIAAVGILRTIVRYVGSQEREKSCVESSGTINRMTGRRQCQANRRPRLEPRNRPCHAATASDATGRDCLACERCTLCEQLARPMEVPVRIAVAQTSCNHECCSTDDGHDLPDTHVAKAITNNKSSPFLSRHPIVPITVRCFGGRRDSIIRHSGGEREER